ncbi:MAG: type II secretion system F family protein, partial [Proteobacteria bacterium]|nr:type II secretion system F family protein [Pseudomonadota bacterium]
MQKFKYTALNSQRKKVSGFCLARNHNHAMSKLRAKRWRPLKMTLVSTSAEDDTIEKKPIIGDLLYKDGSGKIQVGIGQDAPKTKDILRFTGQLGTLLAAGVPMIHSIEILAEQQSSKKFSEELKIIQRAMEKGASLSDALSKIPGRFDPLYVAIIASGEATGNLDKALRYIVTYMERNQKLLDQLKSALVYPAIVLSIAGFIVWFLLS